MRPLLSRAGALALAGTLILSFSSLAWGADPASIERGRYLATVAGCNDCHTSGFAQSRGTLPEEVWLTGDAIGWRGPWGTTYPINLRKLVASLPRDSWLPLVRNSRARPPMPTYVLKLMTDTDLLALYDFIHSLGDAGELMPAALDPGVMPSTPYFNFVPVSAGMRGQQEPAG